MIRVRESDARGKANFGWLTSFHTFSFGDYIDRNHYHFGPLRVINEDYVAAGKGFDMHPHKDMEILTYIVSGELKHQDSMGNTSVISPGRIQYMSAGSGVLHSEFNPSEVNPVHLLQIWIIPNEKGLAPRYEELNFPTNQTLALLASGNEKDGGITIRQDAKLYRGLLKKGEEVELPLLESRKGWLQLIIGTLEVQGKVKAEKGDGIAFEAEDAPKVKVLEDAEFLFFDLPNE